MRKVDCESLRGKMEGTESCVCVVAVTEDDCSPETVAEVFDALDMFNKPEGMEGLIK